jgi:hypothetical protein
MGHAIAATRVQFCDTRAGRRARHLVVCQARSSPSAGRPRPAGAVHHRRAGFFIAFFAVGLGFGMVWHIWWMAIAALLGIVAVVLKLAWRAADETRIDGDAVVAPYGEAA